MPDRTIAARLIADALVANGVERIFCVPGESYLALLDALYDTNIAVTVFRHEGAATMAAEAWGKLTGHPGVVMVTRGPGATNASGGIHVAKQDSTPVIMFVGQVARAMRGREAFQEIDLRAVFTPLAKWADEIDSADRAVEFVSRAFHVAVSGRPGPVVLGLPEDMLRDETEASTPAPPHPGDAYPGLTQIAQLQKMLWAAKRPVVILGGSRWNEASVAGMRRFSERFELPVACSFRRQHLFDNDHPNYIGDVGLGPSPELIGRIKASDLILLVGGRMSESPSQGYTLLDIPEPKQQLVHVHPGPEELGRVYRPALAINASPSAFVAALESVHPPHREVPWSAVTRAARASFEEWSAPVKNFGDVQMSEIVTWLRDRLPDDAIIANGAGNFATWVHRFFRYRRDRTQVAPTSGTMGYGFPAAIAAKLKHPERMVICFSGDGDFQMTSNELQTAVQYDAAVVVIIVNNGIHGTIRMHQERAYPNRVIATDITSPDFAALARAHGAHGETVATTAGFAPAFDRAVASGKPALIEVKLPAEAITTSATMTAIRGTGRR